MAKKAPKKAEPKAPEIRGRLCVRVRQGQYMVMDMVQDDVGNVTNAKIATFESEDDALKFVKDEQPDS